MKKILGISLVAVLAATPLMASAARDASVAVANYNFNGQVSTDVATTSYVKGAYESASDRIDALVTDTNVAENGNYIDANESVAHNLGELDTAVKANADAIGNAEYTGTSLSAAISALQSTASGLGNDKVNQNGNFTDQQNDSALIYGKTVVNAIKDTASAVDANTAAIGDADSGLTKAIADEATRATNAEGALSNRIDALSGNMTGNFATKTGVAATVNAATATGSFNIVQTWGSDNTVTHTITSDVAVDGYVPGTVTPTEEPDGE